MAERNPYAPSQATLSARAGEQSSGGTAVWRDGKVLVLARDTSSLPPRCVKCNEPADEPTKTRTVYWHHPLIYLLILPSILIYVIVALIARKTASVSVGLCARHKQRRVWAITLGWLGVIAGVVLVGYGLGEPDDGAVALGLGLILLAAILGVVFARVLSAKRIDADYVRLKGCGAEFLDTLPEFPG